ncbi:MAG: cation:proton antiporter [Chromatiales bacterium]|nr:cation:proton antiporter [Chromatiales bacterium]
MRVLQIAALVLLGASLVLLLLRLWAGPSRADRLVAADAFSVLAIPGLAWLALYLEQGIYLDVALVYGALAFVGVVTVARVLEGGHRDLDR